MKTASIAPSSAGQRRKIIQQFFGVFYCFCLLFLLPRKFLGFLNPFCSLPVLHRTESHVHFDRVELRVEIARNREADKKRVQHAELGAYLAPRMMMAGRDNRMGEKLFFIMLYFSIIIMLHLSVVVVVVVFHPLCHSLAHSKFMAMARSPQCFILFYDFI